jgi:RNA polymerase sigma-70 factor, ECF subfamily
VTDLARLVTAAQAGDRPAFGELYAEFARTVHGILLARVPRLEVEDLAHDVFVTAMQRIRSLREPEAFAGWLATIARNCAIDHLRRSRGPRAMASLDDEAHPVPVTGITSSETPADRLEALRVLDAIRSLPEAYRETLILRLVEGMTGPEIAARTGLTPASVRVNLHRGMSQLRERLGVTT